MAAETFATPASASAVISTGARLAPTSGIAWRKARFTVTSAILALSRDQATIGSTYHLAAGPGRDTTLGTLAEHLAVRFGRRLPLRVRPVWWQRVVRPALMMLPAPALRRTLQTGLVYRPYLQLRLRFDTTGTRNTLDPQGVRCPRVVDYIDTIVDAAIASDFGKRPVPTA